MQSGKPRRDAARTPEGTLPGRQILLDSAKVHLCFYLAIGTRFCRNRFLLVLPTNGQKIRCSVKLLPFLAARISNTDLRRQRSPMINWSPETTRDGLILFKPWRWMHLEAKRLTGKYRASKMFYSPCQ
jgi:hypothetical protein